MFVCYDTYYSVIKQTLIYHFFSIFYHLYPVTSKFIFHLLTIIAYNLLIDYSISDPKT